MVLSANDIANFQTLYKNEFGMKISREDAYEKGIKLLRLMSIVHKPMTEEKYSFVQKHRENSIELLKKQLS